METAPEKGFFEHCDILRSLVDSCSIMYAPPSGDTALAAAPPSVGKQITVPHYSDISPAMFQCSHPASCSLTPHRGHWAMMEPRGNMEPSRLVSQEHVDITCVGPTLT